MTTPGPPWIVAERGASHAAPEHTIAAYELAVAEGADALWLDVHLSRDGHPVLVHDFTLERTTDGAGPVADHTVRALKRLDAGIWRGPGFAGQRIQMLEEALERFGRRIDLVLALRGGLGVYPDLHERVIAVLDIYRLMERSVIVSFDLEVLGEIRRMMTEARLGVLTAAGYQDIARAPGVADGLWLDAACLSRQAVVTVRSAGLDCYIRGVEAVPDDLSRWAVSGITTGQPARMRARLAGPSAAAAD